MVSATTWTRRIAFSCGVLAACGGVWGVLLTAGARAATPRESDTPAPGPADLAAIVAEVEAGRRATPVVGAPLPGGDVPVTFLARRIGRRVPRVVSDVTGWGERIDGTFDAHAGTMTRIGRTGWYSLETRVAPRARIEYQIAYAVGDNRLDPHNPRKVSPPAASEFVTPGYEAPPALVEPRPPLAGALSERSIQSRALGSAKRIAVYTPTGIGKAARPVALFLDSRAHEIGAVVDWLVTNHIVEPFVAVFVRLDPPSDRHASAEALRAFLSQELPASLAALDGATTAAGERAILAISFGAKDALEVALGVPAGYGRLGLLIPGRRITSADMEAVQPARGAPLRVSILAGRYDLANVDTARGLRRALVDAGHDVRYTEVPEGHSPRTWLHHLSGVLTDLFPPASRQPPLPATDAGGQTSDRTFRERAETLDRRFGTARDECEGRWLSEERCSTTLRRLREEELRLVADVRAHTFSDITESNYWHRGRLKFPSEIAQLAARLGVR